MLDTCNWINRYNSGLFEQWVRKAASDRTKPVGPAIDGDAKASGHYMIVKPSLRTALIRAELLTNNSIVNQFKRSYFTCRMSFKYYMNTNYSSKDSVIFTVSTVNNLERKTIWRTNTLAINTWLTGYADIGEHVSLI